MLKHNPLAALLAVLLALSLAALACAGGTKPTAEPTPTQAPAAVPTKTPKPAQPTAEPVQPTDTPAAAGIVAGEVAIVNSTTYIDNFNYAHVVGLITNNTERPVSSLELTVELRDAAGKSLLRNSDGNVIEQDTTSPMLYTLAPGQSSPFDYWTSADVGKPDKYTVNVTHSEEGSSDPANLEIQNAQLHINQDGDLYFSGELVNLSDKPVQINAFAGAAEDDRGNVLAADYSYSLARYLLPAGDENGNDRTPFIVTIDGPVKGSPVWAGYWDADLTTLQDSSGVDLDPASLHGFFDGYNDFHLVGVVTNNSPHTLNIGLVAGLYDADGVVLDANSTSLPLYIAPGQSVPWHITYFPNLGANDDEAARLDHFTIQIDQNATYDWTFDLAPLKAAEDKVVNNDDGTLQATGKVTNDSGQDLSSATLMLIITDAQGNLVTTDYVGLYPEGEAFKNGDTLPFDLTVYVDPKADLAGFTYEMIVQGYVK